MHVGQAVLAIMPSVHIPACACRVKQKHLCHAVVPFNLQKPNSCQRPHQVQEYRGGGGGRRRRIIDWQEELHIK